MCTSHLDNNNPLVSEREREREREKERRSRKEREREALTKYSTTCQIFYQQSAKMPPPPTRDLNIREKKAKAQTLERL